MAASQVHKRGPVRPQFNMTPLIDVTFLLIIFFMVISNFISEESVQMIVPELDQSKVRELEQMSRIVVNIAPRPYARNDRSVNHLSWTGEPDYVKVGSRLFSMNELDAVTAMLVEAVAAAPKDEAGGSQLEVLLRADSALYFDSVQPVMAAISRAGISKVHLVAYLPNRGPVAEGGGAG